MANKQPCEPCRILDDEELNRPPVKTWRDILLRPAVTAPTAAAAPALAAVPHNRFDSLGPNQFPTAFQTYRAKPVRGPGGGGPFPFQKSEGRGPWNSPAQAPTENTSSELDDTLRLPPGQTLRMAVRAMMNPPPAVEEEYRPQTPPWWDASGNLYGRTGYCANA